MMEDLFEIAKLVEFNAKAEAQAVYDYTELIQQIAKRDIDDEIKEKVASNIEEIIADELNHQEKLQALYTFLTTIEANKS